MVKLSVLVLLLVVSSVKGATYYFSESDGQDSSKWCNQSAPCQTMSRFNALTWQTPFKPGDSILFKRGGTYRGQARDLSWWQGSTGSPITFGSYGDDTAPNPIIAGTTILNGWTSNNNLISTKVISNFTDIQNVFVDGVKMPWSRVPNLSNPPETRYFTINSSASNFLTTTGDNSPSGTWNGATLRARIYLWSVTTAVVQSHTFDGKIATFTLSPPFEQGYVPSPGWKFFVENKIQAVDEPGEWCFDNTSGLLTLFPPTSNFNPSQHVIEAAVYTNAFVYVISTYMSFVNLTFWGQSSSAVLFQQSGSTSTNIVFENCQFIDLEQMGLEIHQTNGISITNCNFTGMQNSALNIQADNAVITNNNVTFVGMVQGHQNKGGGVGIQITGQNPIVANNVILNISYNGIVFSGSSNAQIVNNYVNGYAVTLTMSDGGAIYTYGSQSINSQVKNNIVMNSASLPWDGFTDGSASLSHGIYIDNYCNNISVYGNTVVNVDGSCLFANSGGHTWSNNLLVGAGAEGTIMVEEMAGNTVVNNFYSNNIVYARNPEDVGMIKETSNVNQNTTKMATYQKNTYCNPYGSVFFTWNNAGYEGGKGWEAWQANGRDAGSTLCSTSFGPFYDVGNVTNAVVLNSNPTFETDTSGWVCSSCQMTWMSSSPVSPNSGSMKVSVTSNAYTQIQTKGMNCVEGEFYRLRFNAYSTQEVVFWTGVLENAQPYGIVPKENLVFVIESEVREYSVVFASAVTSPCMVMLGASYGPSTTIYFDDFYMESVNVSAQNILWDYVAVNPSSSTATVEIPEGFVFTDITGQGPISCSISLGPFESKLLIYSAKSTSPCAATKFGNKLTSIHIN